MAIASIGPLSYGLVMPTTLAPRASAPRMACVDEFSISREVKNVRIFDGDYAAEICEEVVSLGKAMIAEKGSFSVCIPGGSIVAAIGSIEPGAFDASKTHIFFANEKVPSYPCIEGGLGVAEKLGIPKEQVYGFGEGGTPAELATKYTELLKSHPAIDNSGAIPSFDLVLLGTGPDAHCGCLFPESDEIKATGSGAIVLAGNDERADGDFLAISMDVMNAAKVAIISAAGAGRADMVQKALSGEFDMFDCPAGMVEAEEETIWFTDQESISKFDEDIEDADEGEE